MVRPREFDSDEALERAMQVFWSKGYEATSLHDLTAAMGLSKSSFYGAFGCKRDVFLAAIQRYGDTVAGKGLSSTIEAAGGGKAGIAAVFRGYVNDVLEHGDARGCFLNISAVEMGTRDEDCASRISRGQARVEEVFLAAVEQGRRRGEISSREDARGLARYLTSSLNGLMVMAKTNRSRLALEDVVRVTLSALD